MFLVFIISTLILQVVDYTAPPKSTPSTPISIIQHFFDQDGDLYLNTWAPPSMALPTMDASYKPPSDVCNVQANRTAKTGPTLVYMPFVQVDSEPSNNGISTASSNSSSSISEMAHPVELRISPLITPFHVPSIPAMTALTSALRTLLLHTLPQTCERHLDLRIKAVRVVIDCRWTWLALVVTGLSLCCAWLLQQAHTILERTIEPVTDSLRLHASNTAHRLKVRVHGLIYAGAIERERELSQAWHDILEWIEYGLEQHRIKQQLEWQRERIRQQDAFEPSTWYIHSTESAWNDALKRHKKQRGEQAKQQMKITTLEAQKSSFTYELQTTKEDRDRLNIRVSEIEDESLAAKTANDQEFLRLKTMHKNEYCRAESEKNRADNNQKELDAVNKAYKSYIEQARGQIKTSGEEADRAKSAEGTAITRAEELQSQLDTVSIDHRRVVECFRTEAEIYKHCINEAESAAQKSRIDIREKDNFILALADHASIQQSVITIMAEQTASKDWTINILLRILSRQSRSLDCAKTVIPPQPVDGSLEASHQTEPAYEMDFGSSDADYTKSRSDTQQQEEVTVRSENGRAPAAATNEAALRSTSHSVLSNGLDSQPISDNASDSVAYCSDSSSSTVPTSPELSARSSSDASPNNANISPEQSAATPASSPPFKFNMPSAPAQTVTGTVPLWGSRDFTFDTDSSIDFSKAQDLVFGGVRRTIYPPLPSKTPEVLADTSADSEELALAAQLRVFGSGNSINTTSARYATPRFQDTEVETAQSTTELPLLENIQLGSDTFVPTKTSTSHAPTRFQDIEVEKDKQVGGQDSVESTFTSIFNFKPTTVSLQESRLDLPAAEAPLTFNFLTEPPQPSGSDGQFKFTFQANIMAASEPVPFRPAVTPQGFDIPNPNKERRQQQNDSTAPKSALSDPPKQKEQPNESPAPEPALSDSLAQQDRHDEVEEPTIDQEGQGDNLQNFREPVPAARPARQVRVVVSRTGEQMAINEFRQQHAVSVAESVKAERDRFMARRRRKRERAYKRAQGIAVESESEDETESSEDDF